MHTFSCRIPWLAALVAVIGWVATSSASAREYHVYFGTFTEGVSRGIYVARFDAATGELARPELAAEIPSPNFLALSPDEKWLYAATRAEADTGGLAVFARSPDTGALQLREQKFSGGAGPCHVSVGAKGKLVLLANYGGGSVKSFHVSTSGALTDGTFLQHQGRSVNPSRQRGPHAHCFVASPGGRFALACDLGLDQVLVYRVAKTNAALTAHDPAWAQVPPGAGPRQLAFSPDGATVYVLNEMACSLTRFAWNERTGKLTLRETVSVLPPGVSVTNTFSGAAVIVRPDGRFVYASVRGHDSIAGLSVNRRTGELQWVENVPCGGRVPRGMGMDPSGRWLIVAHQKSDTAEVFRSETGSGRLTATSQRVAVGSPVDVKFARVKD
jgi:6-phosphogluconolactonase